MQRFVLAGALALLFSNTALAAIATTWNRNPYPSTYVRAASAPILLRGGMVLDGKGGEYRADLVLADGKIQAIGEGLPLPVGAILIDATGKWVTPGIIDVHSHLGVYPSPSIASTSDGNEATEPVTADMWAEHSVWPQDAGFYRALAGGVTSLHVLPGSANLFGGRGVTLKNVHARSVQEMKFPGAPYSLKMACGENPKRVYGEQGTSPATRMGNFAGYRKALLEAQSYQRAWADYAKKVEEFEGPPGGKRKKGGDGDAPTPPDRDLEKETLVGLLTGEILLENHCYRADEMIQVLDMAREFGFKVTAFHHAVESYKVADILAREGVCSAMWADWWGFKLEAYDQIDENIALVQAAGACAIVHSDSELGIQRLNQEAAKALADGRRAGLNVTRGDAWTWLSANPAKALGILETTGTLDAGKAGDVVLWSGDPLSVYAKAEAVFIDGAKVFDRTGEDARPLADFELAQPNRRSAP
jgi:imidazolonepropionase-like amidohydrolase